MEKEIKGSLHKEEALPEDQIDSLIEYQAKGVTFQQDHNISTATFLNGFS
jgi:hypothetical protein